jgi:hypothetical protein
MFCTHGDEQSVTLRNFIDFVSCGGRTDNDLCVYVS